MGTFFLVILNLEKFFFWGGGCFDFYAHVYECVCMHGCMMCVSGVCECVFTAEL